MSDPSGYALGYTESEHDRLERQAERLRSLTESFLHKAGIRDGLRVLDLGSGIGDVAMLAARIVGPAGEVVGVERDPRSVARARGRAAEAGLVNVTFLESDVAGLADAEPFHAVVGRFILQFLPDPVSTLRSVSRRLHPEGIVAFQEVFWPPSLAANSHLPLWSACASIVHEALQRAGANTNMGLALYRIYQEAGISAPQITFDAQMGASRELILWAHNLLLSVHHRLQPDQSVAVLGDFTTLADRIVAEAQSARSVVTSVAVIGAWSRLDR